MDSCSSEQWQAVLWRLTHHTETHPHRSTLRGTVSTASQLENTCQTLLYSMSRYDVANLKVRLGDYEIKTVGETEIFESKAARVVRHKEFSQQTLVIIRGILAHI